MATYEQRKVPETPGFVFYLSDGYAAWQPTFNAAVQSMLYELTAQRQTTGVIMRQSDGSYKSAGEIIPRILNEPVCTISIVPALWDSAAQWANRIRELQHEYKALVNEAQALEAIGQ